MVIIVIIIIDDKGVGNMIVNILQKDKIRKIVLPEKVYGVYSILDNDGKMLANIEAVKDQWVLKSNNFIEISVEGKVTKDVQLSPYFIYSIKILVTNEVYEFIPTPTLDSSNKTYETHKEQVIISNNGDIAYNCSELNNKKLILSKNGNHWTIENPEGARAYINDRSFKKRNLFHGDYIFVNGLKVIVINNTFIINNPKNAVSIKNDVFSPYQDVKQSLTYQKGVSEDKVLYDKDDYFNKAPRFRSIRDDYTLQIAAPPETQLNERHIPIILTAGPMITTNFMTVYSLTQQLQAYALGEIEFKRLIPSIIMVVVTLLSSFMWPWLTSVYEKRLIRKNEAIRRKKYAEYLKYKEKEINERLEFEKQILIENALPLTECQSVIYNKKRNLWERNIPDDDFLSIRLGIGRVKSKINLREEVQFAADDENMLKSKYNELTTKSRFIDDVPMNVSLIEHPIVAVVGNSILTKYFMDSVFLQIMTFHSYRDLKICVITNETNSFLWEYLKVLPHCWDNLRTQRYYADNAEDLNVIASQIEPVFRSRKGLEGDQEGLVEEGMEKGMTYLDFDTYYLFFIDDLELARNIPVIKEILSSKKNYGFSIILRNDKLSNLPSQCKTFIDVEPEMSGLFESDIKQDNQKQFVAELNKDIDMYGCAQRLANVPILAGKAKYELPASISFLTMYNVGKVEQLNSLDRWKRNNPALSLSVPVGINQEGELFKMDAHEKGFGPHGLVAGTTGSGKSEWLITYILSLCVNFHPDEVQFVLIDYKGGGLALSFENKDLGIRLPHLAGTITNLDKSAINRALTSIEAELKARQNTFNEAREKLHESSMDIKKYQQLYRKGLVDKPISHLFLISDEFAELKSQQPEFLDQLVSTARIGRSLGVHLILATQKPDGVVSEQIWSNSRFHICLRVQDKGDSQSMIKTPYAAMLKSPGSFYLQVGYDEYYALGQSAWAGAKYHPSDIVKKEIDDSVQLINNLGDTLNNYSKEKEGVVDTEDHGEELLNIVSYISEISKQDHVVGKQLWLPNIEEVIYLDDVKKKYDWKPKKFNLETVIGIYDNPILQMQDKEVLDIGNNVAIYGETGSGKENLLATIIWSSITEHSPDEINYYLFDFGAETLRMFAKYPHVGEVLFQSDLDKIVAVMQMILDELDKRKQLFADYNGDYDTYLRESGKSLPRWVVVINAWDVFNETNGKLASVLDSVFRDCIKYGISFICTTTTASALRGRRTQFFSKRICLHMPDDYDYRELTDSRKGLIPHNNFGRGVAPINDEEMCEFQTAFITKREEINILVRKNADNFLKYYTTRAKQLPKIPDTVDSKHLETYVDGVSNVPVGYNFYEKDIARLDLTKEKMFIVGVDDIKKYIRSIYGIINVFTKLPNVSVRIVDAMSIFELTNPDIKYWRENLDATIGALNKDSKQRGEDQAFAIDIILGAGQIKNKLGDYGLEQLNELLGGIGTTNSTCVLLVDSYQSLKTLKIEPWFARLNNNFGLWIGRGLENQNIFNVKELAVDERKLNYEGMAFIIEDGNYTIIKTVLDEE